MEEQNLTVTQFTALVRRELVKRTGEWPAIARLSREPKLTYRWLVSLAGREKASHDMARLVELARVLGLGVRLTLIRPRPGAKSRGPAASEA